MLAYAKIGRRRRWLLILIISMNQIDESDLDLFLVPLPTDGADDDIDASLQNAELLNSFQPLSQVFSHHLDEYHLHQTACHRSSIN